MNRIDLAFRTFFWIFMNKKFAENVNTHFDDSKQGKIESKEQFAVVKEQPKRSEAVQLLGLLQREGRLVDFLQESIDSYADAQIGAAVRDIHRDCAAVVKRIFAVEPLLKKEEGEAVSVLNGFDPEQYRLTGNVTGNPPYNGTLRHHGWKATKTELPVWRGQAESADVIAAAEIEIS
jgi:hypothetical protein